MGQGLSLLDRPVHGKQGGLQGCPSQEGDYCEQAGEPLALSCSSLSKHSQHCCLCSPRSSLQPLKPSERPAPAPQPMLPQAPLPCRCAVVKQLQCTCMPGTLMSQSPAEGFTACADAGLCVDDQPAGLQPSSSSPRLASIGASQLHSGGDAACGSSQPERQASCHASTPTEVCCLAAHDCERHFVS